MQMKVKTRSKQESHPGCTLAELSDPMHKNLCAAALSQKHLSRVPSSIQHRLEPRHVASGKCVTHIARTPTFHHLVTYLLNHVVTCYQLTGRTGR